MKSKAFNIFIFFVVLLCVLLIIQNINSNGFSNVKQPYILLFTSLASLLYLLIISLEKIVERNILSKEEISSLLFNIDDKVVFIGLNGKLISWNVQFEKYYKSFFDKSLKINSDFSSLWNEKDKSNFQNIIVEVVAGEIKFFESEILTIEGKVLLKFHFNPIRKGNKINKVLVVIKEIINQGKSFNQFQRDNIQLESIFDYSTDAMFIFDDKLKFVLDCNKTAVEVFEAFDKSQIVGLRFQDLLNDNLDNEELESIIYQLKNGQEEYNEFRFKTLKEHLFLGVFSGKLVSTKNGSVCLIRITDITQKRQIENQLIDNELKFKTLADSSPAMLWISDKNGKIIFYNKAWLDFRGSTLEEEMHHGWKEAIHPDDYEWLIKEVWNPSVENKESYTIEYRLKNFQGDYKWVLENAVPRYNYRSEFEGLYGSAIDITPLKEVHNNIVKTEEKFKNMANASPVMLWFCDEDGDIIFFNKAWLKFTGRQLEEEIGKGWISGVHHEDIHHFVYETYYESVKNQTSYSVEYRLKRYDGQYRWILENGVPKYNDNGEFEGLIGSAFDITERKISEIKLRQQDKFTSRIAELSPDVIYIYDINLRQNIFQNRNLAQFLGYSESKYPQFTQSVFDELIHPSDLQLAKYNDEHFQKFNTQNIVELEFRLKDAEGNWRWIKSRESPFLYSSDNKLVQILGSAHDVTESKNFEIQLLNTNKELKSVNEELDSFVYRASHDLRAPMSSILGLVNLAKKDNKDDNMLVYFEMIEKSIEKLVSVTQDLIDHARNARTEINIEKINFNLIINDIIEGLKFHENVSKIKFEIQVDTFAEFYCDKMRLILLFNNLISNAVKYHDKDKNNKFIKISVSTTKKKAIIVIEDNGLGIEKEHHEKLFDMFFRANKTISGTGLGLFIVKGALDKISGTISFDSEYKKGTKFIVNLPNLKKNKMVENEN